MTRLQQRLLPLFIADFCIGFMFYWSIMFPFMDRQGLTSSELGLYVIVSNLTILALEVPSGILADRWSRKGTIMVGMASLAVGATLFGMADSFWDFMIGTMFASAYYALNSGMKEAMLYDTLLEEDNRKDYEKQLGRLKSINIIGVVISSIAGAIIASKLSFTAPYYMSVISCILALIFVARFKEPQLHKQAEATKLFVHITTLFRALNQHREMRLLVITSVLVCLDFMFMTELDQIWPIAMALPVIWFGPWNAFLMSSIGFASPIAGYITNRSRQIALVSLGSLLAATGLLVQNIYVIVVSEFILLATATILGIILSGRVQDQLPSSQRSGAESAINTIATVIFIGTAFLFTFIAEHYSVFNAAWLVVGITALAVAYTYTTIVRRPVAT